MAVLSRTLRCAWGGVFVLAMASCGGRGEVDFTARVVDPPFTVDARPLRGDQGRTVTLGPDEGADQLRLVFFGYTHCPDICLVVLGSLASGLTKLSGADRAKVQTYFVTSDPKRDTAEVLATYLDHIDPSFRGLTGSLTDIAAVGESVGIHVDVGSFETVAAPFETVAAQPPQGPSGRSPQGLSGGYDPDSHSTYVVAVGKDGKAPVFWDAETSPSQFAADIEFLLHGE